MAHRRLSFVLLSPRFQSFCWWRAPSETPCRFFLFNFLLHLYLAVDKLTHLVSLQAVVDIVTVFPSYLILFMNVSETPPLPLAGQRVNQTTLPIRNQFRPWRSKHLHSNRPHPGEL